MSKPPKYSLVIPVYNEEANLQELNSEIKQVMSKLNESYEVIYINDGSRDHSLLVLRDLVKKDKNVKFLSFSRNFGHQAALTAGLDHAKGQAIISMDSDLQDPPQLLPEMIEKWKQGYEIVYARRKRRHDSFFKKYTALAYYRLLNKFSEVKIPRNVGDFRLIDRKVLDELKGMREKARYLRGMVAWLGFRFTFVDFDRPERKNGKTNYTLTKMARLAMNGILNFSLLPLKLGLFMGLASIFVGIIFLIYMIIDILLNSTIYQLYKWLAVILLIFAGIQFMFLWIIGEYIGRIHNETKDRPLYVIREKKE